MAFFRKYKFIIIFCLAYLLIGVLIHIKYGTCKFIIDVDMGGNYIAGRDCSSTPARLIFEILCWPFILVFGFL